ncbi:DUF2256 domain-containing protein [Ahrensia sp. R2A130]|uniref:DUF2256 domain-containing protein n=1 Tax=Ahrensia sp. R2A130 TaxID=744979 RepID=UPI000A0382A4|nr:DUF2256 domain-containing protein [Ahrensia sp. R2A130]
MAHKKAEIPEKPCVTCGRPFMWRKKWAKNWDEVKYCSKRCAGQRNTVAARFGEKPRSER